VKRVKNTLAASRVSQRAAILSKKRTASAVPATSPNQVFEEDAPELLREKDGGAGLDQSLDLSSTPPPPPRPPLTPSTPSPRAKSCDCTEDCVEDGFHDFFHKLS
jgi:hypothetical protein